MQTGTYATLEEAREAYWSILNTRHMKREKGEMRIIEMHLVLDMGGKVTVPPELMEALGIAPGDMLSFHFGDEGVTVKGGKKPPYFHADTIALARSSRRHTAEQHTSSTPPKSTPHTELTQMPLFGEAAALKKPQRRRSR